MFGLLGKKLTHSFSKQIHERITGKEYSLIEVEDLENFFTYGDFTALNVTIPYKHDVIKYLDNLSNEAKEIGSVNTIINKNGIKTGYNTDYYGLEKTLIHNDISVKDKDIIILGNGSTSRTIKYYCEKNHAKNIYILARNPNEDEYNFEYRKLFKNTQIIFNATPVGMFPNNYDTLPIVLNSFSNLVSVVDVIYNPLSSNLLIHAKNMGLQVVNGLFMLINQAIKSIELFHDTKVSDNEMLQLYNSMILHSLNLVFIGMPMSGKSFIARKCSTLYNKDLIELDYLIEKDYGDTIPNIFKKHGEYFFRSLETKKIKEYSTRHNQAISCGGGVVLNNKNIDYLRQNGIIIFLNVPLDLLQKSNPKNRPLLKNRNNLEKLYQERYNLYMRNADIVINKDTYDESKVLHEIEVKLNEYLNS